MPNYYKVMLGEESKYAAECYEGEFIGTWYEINEDLTDYLSNKEGFVEKYLPLLIDGYSKFDKKTGKEREEQYKKQSANLVIPQLWIFCNKIQINDIVICPTGKKFNSYHIGEIKSDYYFKIDYFKKDGKMQPHRRDIKWYKNKISINDMSVELIELLKSHGTVIDLNQSSKNIIKELNKLYCTVSEIDQFNNKINELTQVVKEENITEINNKLKKYTENLFKYLNQFVIRLLVQFLKKSLPTISNDWWEITVKDKLKPYQLKRIKRNNINSLDEFDLAELLLIIDNNWYDISQECNFMYDDRNIMKEMISVRNRVSHLSNVGYSYLIDLFRDFDTMRRLLIIINIEQENIKKTINEIYEIMLEIMREILVNK